MRRSVRVGCCPRARRVEVNRDEYVKPEPLERAQTVQDPDAIVDRGNPLSVDEIREAERLTTTRTVFAGC